jgi:hypothetical protein
MGEIIDDTFEDDGILVLSAAVTAPAFAKKDKSKAEDAVAAPTAARPSGDAASAATVGGAVITMEELDRAAANQLSKVRQQEYEVRSGA